jgi:hypothetical protein
VTFRDNQLKASLPAYYGDVISTFMRPQWSVKITLVHQVPYWEKRITKMTRIFHCLFIMPYHYYDNK